MSLVRQLTRGLRVLTRGRSADRDLDDEVRHFYDEAAADAVAQGSTADDARRNARLAYGDRAAVREEVRTHGWEHAIETVLGDVRYTMRGFRRRPSFATVAAVTLALGIGASTAIFSAVDPILFEPLPYPHAGRIISIADRDSGGAGIPIDVAYGTYLELAHRSRSFGALATADRWQPALTGRDTSPERLAGDFITSDYFRVLGVEPLIGRDFVAADDVRGTPRVVIVSNSLARRRFGTAQTALGQSIELDAVEYTIVGIMPAGFENVLNPADDVWAPRRYRSNAPFESAEWGHHQRMIGRLAPGVTVDEARGELTTIARSPSAAFARPAWAGLKQGLEVRLLQAAVTNDVRPALLAIFAAVTLVLLVAAVNVTNLLLARGAQRRGELALRVALGAGRGRIVRQLLTESLLLAFGGGGLGLVVATIGIRGLVALAPANLPRVGAIALDVPAFAFAVVLTAIIGIAIGLYPAVQGAGQGGGDSLQPGTRIAGAASHMLRRALVVAEVALALVLLVGAGLMVRSLARLMSIPPGFDPSGLLTMQVEAAGPAYNPDPARYQFFAQALEAVRRLPGVSSAAFSSQLPLGGEPDEGYGVHFQAQGSNDPNGDYNALRYAVTPGWFKTMDIPLRRGRLLDDRDRPGAQESIVISEALARQVFSGKDPIGQQLRAGPELAGGNHPWDVVVGVVGDVKQDALSDDNTPAFYVAMGQWDWVDNVQTVIVRTDGDPTALIPSVKAAIWSVDRNQPIIRVNTMETLVARSEAERRFVLMVLSAFGLAALALAAIGVYGVISGGVTERITEIGVRAALGASRSTILMMILGEGVVLAGIGVVFGAIGAAMLSSTLRTLIFGISRADAVTYVAAAITVLIIAVVASAAPAARAARIDPSAALRA